MKRSLLSVICSLLTVPGWMQTAQIPVIPLPAEFIKVPGKFLIDSATVIVWSDSSLLDEVALCRGEIRKYTGLDLKCVKNTDKTGQLWSKFKNAIIIYTIYSNMPQREHYRLTIDTVNIGIGADDGSGIVHGIESMVQLISYEKNARPYIPCWMVDDKPRYIWRGMHLDVCRHFFTKEEVEKYIDYLALYKFNVFHWHLCDDQGWRIEIKKYPKLTEVGSMRKETMVGKPSKDQQFDGKPYGGFYTQEEIKEVVAYAAARHITIVPEIEMPGHALAALAAYPQYSCNQKPLEVGTTWGVFDDVYCAGNDSTFAFLEDVLTEVCALFPGKIIHIGGDECQKERWKTCPKCQQRIKTEKLKDEHELQSYFIQRIEKFLNAKGRTIIGWDEILEGGLAPNAWVMSWRGTQGGIDAAKQHHAVVMTPGKPCYFDHYQAKDRTKEPLAIGGFNPLDSVYKYDPMPNVLSGEEKQYILGAQGNVWTEYITTFKQVEYMAIPRMCALSEALWTDPKNKNYKDFVQRLKIHAQLLDKMGVNYARHFRAK